ncbi:MULTISPECIES: hypothetical protein [Nocardia]|uniref:Uncharacterized protein n=2 Tax=Nocardia TaxID=1817 RepID=U5EDZ4_NOCAS|nr:MULTISPECIES: hypothetical protein [Nocardia]TLF67669.1 hypothetical protein FEK33_17305 [Nocardia asteroides NBRC 15531]UGT50770.1 hypothetical protein LT345_09600 [Nocardia asteroides]SFN82776.1 hypothetical protein SAMN05444423_11548 [Nocardia asteroides]VEG36389.1 Uncharacterised protein [Nocardia asteroides]GAD83424.1 hypothetical protein NCAST_19_01260 [Nocardia asteroides NBRC 15531]
MITHVGELTAWLQAQIPDPDDNLYEPWNTGTPTTTSLVSLIHLRVQTPFAPDRTVTVVLVAYRCPAEDTAPDTEPPDSRHPCPQPPDPDRRRPSVFRSPRAWRRHRSRQDS